MNYSFIAACLDVIIEPLLYMNTSMDILGVNYLFGPSVKNSVLRFSIYSVLQIRSTVPAQIILVRTGMAAIPKNENDPKPRNQGWPHFLCNDMKRSQKNLAGTKICSKKAWWAKLDLRKTTSFSQLKLKRIFNQAIASNHI